MSSIEFYTLKKENFKIGQWSGGSTSELAIYPPNSRYKEQRFIWRLSSATIDTEESDFTSLPDYDRVLIVLNGEVVLVHKEKRVIRLAQYEQDRFSGSYETKSFGKITDFNLMVKKGNQGFSEVITVSKEYMPLIIDAVDEYRKMSQCFYCTEGFCVINFNQECCMLNAGELLIINCDYGVIDEIGIMGEGKAIRTHVYFNEEQNVPENEQPIEKQKQTVKTKVTLEDLKLAAIVCWSNFRGGKYIFRSMKNVWFDEELQHGIDKIERILLPYIICLIGFGFVGFYSYEYLPSDLIAPAILLWILVDIILINPLLYLLILPKPVRVHIKKFADLTESEKTIYEKQKSENKTADKILKKYEKTGRNKYID